MRTTITLDPDVDVLLRTRMRERGLTFKEVVNEALREGLLAREERSPFETPTFDLGGAKVPVEDAVALAGRLEDQALLRKRTLSK